MKMMKMKMMNCHQLTTALLTRGRGKMYAKFHRPVIAMSGIGQTSYCGGGCVLGGGVLQT